MIDYANHIKPFEATHSDEAIAVYCNTLCHKPINCSELRTLCASAGVIAVDENQKYIGSLVDFLFSDQLPTQLKSLARWFFQHVWMDKAVALSLDGSSPVVGVDGFTVVFGFGTLTKTASDSNPAFGQLVQAMVGLAGGFVYQESLTASDIASARSAYQAQKALSDAKEALIESARNTFEQYRVTVAEWNGIGDSPKMGE